MTTPYNVPTSTTVPGAYEKVGDRANAFRAPIHQMLADRSIKKHSPLLFEVISSDDIQIEDEQGRIMKVLSPGTFFTSMTWDYNKEWHLCCIKWDVKE